MIEAIAQTKHEKANNVLKKLKPFFVKPIDTEKQEDAFTNLQWKENKRNTPTEFLFFMNVLLYSKGRTPSMVEVAEFHLPLFIGDNAEQKFIGYLDGKENFVPEELNTMKKILLEGWLLICDAIYRPSGWRREKSSLSQTHSQNTCTFDYTMVVECTDKSVRFFKYYKPRKFEIKSIINANENIKFTLKLDDDGSENTYDFPAEIPKLIECIKDHFNMKFTTIFARYEAHIQHVTRLLDLIHREKSTPRCSRGCATSRRL
jgi:hypothetical protein